jgi:hypothetical protein
MKPPRLRRYDARFGLALMAGTACYVGAMAR